MFREAEGEWLRFALPGKHGESDVHRREGIESCNPAVNSPAGELLVVREEGWRAEADRGHVAV